MNGQRLVAEAMSGFGKTSAVLAGAIAAATDQDLQVVYVCRTKRQVFRVIEELNRFSKRVPVRATSLFSKFDYCILRKTHFHVSSETFKWYCSFHTSNNLCSYFLNVPFNHEKIQRLADIHTSGPGQASELIRESEELHVCPYEVAKISLAMSRLVVTTYHYLLDEGSRSIMIPGDKPLGKTVAVIDEAHNVREFIAGSSAVTLRYSDLENCVDAARMLYLPLTSSAVGEIADRVRRFCSRSDEWLLDKRSFVRAIVGDHLEDWLSDLVFELTTNSGVAWYSVATERNLPSSLVRLGEFLSALLASIDRDEITLARSPSTLYLTDTQPAKRFLKATAGFRSLVLLSATINPPHLFLRSIGLAETSTILYSAVTSHRFKVKTLVDTGVTTRFKARSNEMYSKIGQRIAAVCGSTSGGVGVFLPSYAFLHSTLVPLLDGLKAGGRKVLVERPGLSNEESDAMMHVFKSNRGCVLMAVQGGRFSEGEDFPGDEMDVSIVVGLALSPPSPMTYADYRQMEADGLHKQEAYLLLALLPALRKAFQCAGRHIREPNKMGIILFMDSRFADQKVLELMPGWLKGDLVKGDFGPASVSALTIGYFGAMASSGTQSSRRPAGPW
ncbi:MAG: hypothetical protein JRM82_00025 [Nitrososphaerota archaeon]|nr:hypothetical protein [Nitrososphaerota archaeon]